VRGVTNVEVNEQICEAVVSRRRGEAPNPSLLSALETVGYPGALLPIEEMRLKVADFGTPERVGRLRDVLRNVRGVRRFQIVVSRGANVALDRRVLAPADLVKAVREAGLEVAVER
jgi:copper chaperone CopZ